MIEKINRKASALQVYQQLRSFSNIAVLDSSLNTVEFGRYSIIVFNPFLTFQSKGTSIKIVSNKVVLSEINSDPLQYLKELIAKYKIANETGLPFIGGCVGYFAYDLFAQMEEKFRVPDFEAKKDANVYDCVMAFYNNAVVIDHWTDMIYITAISAGLEGKTDIDHILRDKIDAIKQCLLKPLHLENEQRAEHKENAISDTLTSNFTKKNYCKMIDRAKEYIRNGDIFQANLSQQFMAQIQRKPDEIYNQLTQISPAPFSAFLSYEDLAIISTSPERFFKIDGRRIETKPIKGTRPRGKTPAEDDAFKAELLASEKDKAEHIMIVDLERNDLGRVCKIGTVKVDKLLEVEQYVNVFHLVSTVSGELNDNIDMIDCIKAMFPGGSITGAPKIRAMEIINELETVGRGIYTGSIGYIGFDGNCDLNIAIRTIIMKNNQAYYSVGGGIVWDSTAQGEYEETLHKGKLLMQVLSS